MGGPRAAEGGTNRHIERTIMTSINTQTNPSALLWSLQQRFLANGYASNNANNGAASSAASGTANTTDPSTTQSSGTTGSDATQTASPTTNGVTGPNAPTLDGSALFILIDMQAQQSASPTATSASAGGQVAQNFFSSLDTNGDGQIRQSELHAASPAGLGATPPAHPLLQT